MTFERNRNGGGQQKISFSKMEKEEIKSIRNDRLSSSERIRRCSAKILRIPLLFAAPIALSTFMLILLVVIYIVRPFSLTRNFTRTRCQVTNLQIVNGTSASCSAGSDSFQPCVKVQVSYATEMGFRSGVIMENEQALINCNTCSYTFGKHSLFQQYQYACENWKYNFDPTDCVNDFIDKNAQIGSLYPCYFNPDNSEQIVRNLTLDLNMVIHTFSWPVLACLAYLLAWIFVCYDAKQTKLLDQFILEELMFKQKRQAIANKWRKRKLSQSLGVRTYDDIGSLRNGVTSFVSEFDDHTKRISLSLPSLCNFRSGIMNSSANLCDNESIEDLPFGIADEDHFDLRHLDLAVSEQNINDLSEAFEDDLRFIQPLQFSNTSNFRHTYSNFHAVGHSYQTLPVLPISSLNSGKYTFGNGHPSHRTLPNGLSSFSDSYGHTADSNRHSFDGYGRNPAALTAAKFNNSNHTFCSLPSNGARFCDTAAGFETDGDEDFYYTVIGRRAESKNEAPLQKNGKHIVEMFTANDESKV